MKVVKVECQHSGNEEESEKDECGTSIVGT